MTNRDKTALLEWFAKVLFAFSLNFIVVLLVLNVNGSLNALGLALGLGPTLMVLVFTLLTVIYFEQHHY